MADAEHLIWLQIVVISPTDPLRERVAHFEEVVRAMRQWIQIQRYGRTSSLFLTPTPTLEFEGWSGCEEQITCICR